MEFKRKWPLGLISGAFWLGSLVPLAILVAWQPLWWLAITRPEVLVTSSLAPAILGAFALWRMSRPHSIRVDRDRVCTRGLFGLFPRELVRGSMDAERRSGSPRLQVALETSALVMLVVLNDVLRQYGSPTRDGYDVLLVGMALNLFLCQRYWSWRRAEHFWLMGVDRRGRARRVVFRTRAFRSWGELRAQLLGGPAHSQSETERWQGVIDTNAIARPVLVAAEPVGIA